MTLANCSSVYSIDETLSSHDWGLVLTLMTFTVFAAVMQATTVPIALLDIEVIIHLLSLYLEGWITLGISIHFSRENQRYVADGGVYQLIFLTGDEQRFLVAC